MKNKIITIVFIVLLILMAGLSCFASYKFYQCLREQITAKESFDELSQLTDTAIEEAEDEEERKEKLFEAYKGLKEENSDFVGWIKIEGTNIDYPVMQSMEYPEFYLDHDFNKKYNSYGVPFMDAACLIGKSNNLLIYGHHMHNESMFHEITYYKDPDYLKEHEIISFNTFDEIAEYQAVACFCWDCDGDTFRFNQFTDMDLIRFKQFMKSVHEREYYSSGTDALYGEELLTLVTCDYTYGNGRFVLVAKKVKQ